MAKGTPKLTARMKRMPVFKTSPRPTKPRTPPVRTYGPEHLRLQAEPESRSNLFTTVPAGFVTAHTSATEWMVYAGLAVVTKSPRDPTKPPFVGGDTWTYQKAVDGGRNTKGGQVVDFVVEAGGHTVGIRVQTERWHILAGSAQIANDFFLKTHLKAVDFLIDIFDMDFIGDPTGRAVCAVLQKALKLEQNPDPIRSGRFYPVRP